MNCFFDIFSCVPKRRSVPPFILIDLPELVLEKILENLDFHSILILRKVCHDLRDFIDRIRPSSHLRSIAINVQSTFIDVQLYFPSGPKSFNGYQSLYIEFHKTENGCRLEYNTKMGLVKKCFKKEDFVKIALNDLKVLLNHQKSILKIFRLEFIYFNNPRQWFDTNLWPICEIFLEGFMEILESRRSTIQVEDVQMTVMQQAEAFIILHFVDPEVLQKIEIRGEKDYPRMSSFKIDHLEKLDQWKKAKDLSIRRFRIFTPFEKFSHFRKVELLIQEVSVKSILELKESFKFCPKVVEHFNIEFIHIDDFQLLVDSLGPPTMQNEEGDVLETQWIYRLQVPLKFLSISIFSPGCITLKVVDSSEVPRRFPLLEL